MGPLWMDPDYFARMRRERERQALEHREIIARLDEFIRELNAELDADEEEEATRIQIVAARPSPARYTLYEAMGVQAPWYVRVKDYFNRRMGR